MDPMGYNERIARHGFSILGMVSYSRTVQEGSFLLTTQIVDRILEATDMGPL